MSSRGKRGRGRPPKTWSLSSRSHFLKVKKPKSFARGPQSDFGENTISGSGSSSPVPTSRQRLETRGRSREAARKSRSFIHKVLSNDTNVGGAWEDDASGYSASDFDAEVDDASDDSNDTFDDTASTWSETSYSTIGSTPGRRRYFPKRSRTPELIDQKDIPPLTLPPSATDLVINSENLLQALSVYEVLRHFRSTLRLSPFRFEDFCVALTSDEQCCLLSETHIALLKAMLREEDGNNTMFGPHDLKDSINICLHFLDSMTWYELIRTYLDSDRTPEYRSSLPCLEKSDYCSLTVGERLNILQTLTDLFLGTNAIREEIMSEGNIHYDDHCRSCHRLGDLLCCEMCPAVYHLGCVVPPLEEVPENDWLCSVCRAHQVKGVCECVSELEKSGLLCRQDPLGVDRHQRKYWFLCRHLVIEGENEVWYYSSRVQLDELVSTLDADHWERELVRAIHEVKDDIVRQMALTEELTRELKGHKKAVLDMEAGALLKLQSERMLKKAQEAERKAREAEEKTQGRDRETEEDMDTSGSKSHAEKDGDVDSTPESQATVTLTTTVTSTTSVTSLSNDMAAPSVHIEQVTQSVSVTATSTVTTPVVTDSKDGSVGDKDVGDKTVDDKGDGDKEQCDAMQEGNDLLELARLEEEKAKTEKEAEGDGKKEGEEEKVEATEHSETNLTDGSVAMETSEEATASAEEKKPAVVQTKVVHVPSMVPNVKVTVLEPGDKETVSQPAASESVDSLEGEGEGEGDGKGRPKLSGDQEKGAGDGSGVSHTVQESVSKTTVETRRIITRSKTGSLTPKHFCDSVTKSIMKTSKTNSDDTVVVINKDGDMTRVTRSRSSASVVNHQVAHYRLGMENTYRSYENQYSTNTLALNKHQHNEERVKRQHLSHKFSLTPLSEFKWNGNIYGNKATITATLRLSLIQLENAVPSPFLHPNWSLHRQNWLKAVHLCSKPRGFALVLLTLESCIKPVLFNHVWHDSLGHNRLQRITVIEREEMKKREKETRRRKDDEEEVASVWVKYALGLKHQVWKQKGEEYRIAGNGGWLWVSQTRRCLPLSQDKVGLRAVAAKQFANRARSGTKHDGEKTVASDSVTKMEVDDEGSDDAATREVKDEETTPDNHPPCETMQIESTMVKSEIDTTVQVKKESNSVELIDVSAELVTRGQYPLVVKPQSRLDGLLEKRLRQNEIEMKNKTLLTQALAKYRAQELNKGTAPKKIETTRVTSENKLAVMKGSMTYSCYSAMCRGRVSSDGQCYSVTCARRTNHSHNAPPESRSANEVGSEVEKSNSQVSLPNGLDSSPSETGDCVMEAKERQLNCGKAAVMKSGDSNIADTIAANVAGMNSVESPGIDSKHLSESESAASVESSDTKGSVSTNVGNGDTKGSVSTSVEGSDVKVPVSPSVASNDMEVDVSTTMSSDTKGPVSTNTVSSDTKGSVSTSLVTSDTKGSVSTSLVSSDTKSSVSTSLVSSDTKSSVSTSLVTSDTHSSVSTSLVSSDTKSSMSTSLVSCDSMSSTSTSLVSSDIKSSLPKLLVSSDTKCSVSTAVVTSVSKSSVLTSMPGSDTKVSVSTNVTSKVTRSPAATGVKGNVAKGSASNTVISMQSLIQGGKIHLTPDSVAELESKLENVGCTRFKTSIGRFARTGRKSPAGRYVLRKGGIPNVHKFMTCARRSSLFCLDRFQTRRLARFGGRRETPGFNYNCKMNNVYWPYPCPRTLFKTAWRYRTHCVKSLAGAALQLRVLWACIRWDDLSQKPPAGGTNTVTSETDIVTKELLKRREIGPYGLQSEFLVRKIVVPIGVASQPKEKYTPQRSGLRERRRAESPTQREPSILEKWTPEEELELWEIKLFAEKVEKQKAAQQEKAAVTAVSSTSTPHKPAASTTAKTPSTKLELEEQLKQQRQAMQQRRLLDPSRLGTVPHRPLSSGLRVITTTGGVGTSSTIVRVTPVTPGGSTRLVPQNTSNSGIHRLSTAQPMSSSINIRPRSILSAGHVHGSPKVVKPLTTIRPAQIQVKGGATAAVSAGASSSTNTQATVQSLRIIQDQSGQMHVHGLLPGQQIVRLADGRLQLLTTSTAATQLQKQSAAVIPAAPATQPMKIMVSQAQPQPQPAVALQVAPSVAIKNNMTPQKVPQQPLLQAVRLPSGQVQIRPLVRTSVPTAAGSIVPKLTLMTPGVASNLRIATTPVSHGTVMPRTVLAVAPSTRPTTPQLLHAANVTGGVSLPLKQGQVSPVTPTAGVTLVRTQGGQPILIKTAVPAAVAVTSTVAAAATPSAGLMAREAGSATAGKYTVTPQVVQQVVRQAMLQTNDPEIQAKLAAMQKQMTLESSTPESSRSTTQQLMAVLQQQRQQQTHTEVTRVKSKVIVTQEQREHKARLLVCTQVLKSLVDRVEREERLEEKRLRKLESADEKQRHVIEQQHQQLLLRHKEQLKRDMLRKRALLEKALATHIQSEISAVLHQPPPPSSQKAAVKRHSEVVSTSTPVKPQQVTAVKTEGPTNQHLIATGAKKRKLISTGMKHSSTKLYCVCRTPYDDTKFYIGCDLCSNWFHGACVGIDETKARRIDTYVCAECQRQKTNTSEELYCICQTPYDDTQFYIGCDRCQDWFHGSCVGVSKAEADHMDSYVCPNCRRAGRSDDDSSNQQLLVGRSWDQLRQLVRGLKSHKMSWPFLEAVDPKEVPEYYRVIKEPMDLTTVEKKVSQQQYVKLGDFVKDVMRVFDNCRYFNSSDTPYYQCAEVLENFFVQKLKNFKDTL